MRESVFFNMSLSYGNLQSQNSNKYEFNNDFIFMVVNESIIKGKESKETIK